MALKFNKQNGGKKKVSVDRYVYTDGEQKFRLVGDIRARYVYWVETKEGKAVPFECLAFNPETETFDNAQRDYVKEFFPDLKCSWAYATQCVDENGTVKVVDLKKKLWAEIMNAADDLGDPTDPDEGYDIYFKKVKTGPLAFNVEYQLQVLKCQKNKKPLNEAQRAALATLKSMDEIYPRATPESQRDALEKIKNGFDAPDEESDDQSNTTDTDSLKEFDIE